VENCRPSACLCWLAVGGWRESFMTILSNFNWKELTHQMAWHYLTSYSCHIGLSQIVDGAKVLVRWWLWHWYNGISILISKSGFYFNVMHAYVLEISQGNGWTQSWATALATISNTLQRICFVLLDWFFICQSSASSRKESCVYNLLNAQGCDD